MVPAFAAAPSLSSGAEAAAWVAWPEAGAAAAGAALLFGDGRLRVTPTPPQTPWAKFTVAGLSPSMTLHVDYGRLTYLDSRLQSIRP